MRALLSVSDKNGIVEFAKELQELGFEIISTGGTFKKLQESGVEVIEIDKITKFPECFDGRVKTLNPFVHGGILYRRDNDSHVKQAKELEITGIDLVCVNLYPFKETIERTDDFEEIIENIDIGGPTMVRSAAKNFKDVLIVTDSNDYSRVVDALKNKEDSFEFRRDLMIKAYEHTAAYDSMIANYMNGRFNEGFGAKQFIVGSKVFNTRYGENPHQSGALYEFDNFFSQNFVTLKGEASFNNLTDINSALKIATSFGDRPAVCIVKHGNPCGFAIKDTLINSYTEALKCDPVSAFGGVVAINGVVDLEFAKKLNEIFLEVVIAGDYTPEALEELHRKKRIKLFAHKSDKLKRANDKIDFKHIDGGFVYQNSDCICDNEVKNAKLVTNKEATAEQMLDLEIAWKLNEIFLEVVIAGDYTPEALEELHRKKRIKLFAHKSDKLKRANDKIDFKHIDGGFVYQNSDCICDNEVKNAKLVTNKEATAEQMLDLEIAWKVAGLTKSNCVVYVKNGAMVAVGMGMTSRVDAAQCAIKKAKEMGLELEGSSLASEAFFPFRDSVDAAAAAGVSAIIQPGGSIRDEEVIEAANEHNIAMYFTTVRHFLH